MRVRASETLIECALLQTVVKKQAPPPKPQHKPPPPPLPEPARESVLDMKREWAKLGGRAHMKFNKMDKRADEYGDYVDRDDLIDEEQVKGFRWAYGAEGHQALRGREPGLERQGTRP